MLKKSIPFLIFAFAGLLCLRLIAIDSDVWYQMLSGRYWTEHLAIPHREFFLYAGAGSPQIFGGWGFGLAFHGAYSLFSFAGPSLLNAAIWGAILATAHLVFSQPSMRPAPALPWSSVFFCFCAAACLCLGLWNLRVNMRAESSFYLLWLAGIYAIEKASAAKRPSLALAVIPALCIAESLMHTAALFLLALYPWAWARFGDSKIRMPRIPLFASAIASLALPIANPNGAYQTLLQPMCIASSLAKSARPALEIQPCFDARFATAGTIVDPAGHVVASSFISEYLGIFDKSQAPLLPDFAVCCAVLLMVLAAAFRTKSKSGAAASGLCAFALLSTVLHARAMGIFACFALIPLAMGLELFAAEHRKLKRALPALGAFLILATVAKFTCFSDNWGIGLESADALAIAKSIQGQSPQGARIATISNGAFFPYILGDSYAVAHSGHELFDNPESNYLDFMIRTAPAGFEKILDSFGTTHACLPWAQRIDGAASVNFAPISLAQNGSWRMDAANDQCALFAKLPQGQRLPDSEISTQSAAYYDRLENHFQAYWLAFGNPNYRDLALKIHEAAANIRKAQQ